MINPLDYLYYIIYVAWSNISGGGRPINNTSAIGFLMLSNMYTVYIAINKTLTEAFGIGSVIFEVIFCAIYFNIKKEEMIIQKFENESNKSRMIGNIIVIAYSLLSLMSLIYVLKYIMIKSDL